MERYEGRDEQVNQRKRDFEEESQRRKDEIERLRLQNEEKKIKLDYMKFITENNLTDEGLERLNSLANTFMS